MSSIYNWQQIKDAADCVELCENHLGLVRKKVSGEHTYFDNPWRPGSDSGAFSVCRKGYKDHVSNESGSAIDLIANAKFSGDMWAAQEWLAKLYNVPPEREAKEKRSFVCAYDYHDDAGAVLFQTVRWKPKNFSQRRPDPDNAGKWLYNLNGITPVLYRRADWRASAWVCVVGGEKDADRLLALGVPATTNAMGEGNWRESYNAEFKGRCVCIIPDNDEAGRKHAEVVAFAIRSIAKQIKIVQLPNLPPKGDTSDWIDAGGTRAALLDIISTTPAIAAEGLTTPTVTQKQISDAKKANAQPFRNFDLVQQWTGKKNAPMKQPRHINAMVADVKRRFWGFPRRIGGTLFDLDRNTGRVRHILSPAGLIAWITEKSGNTVDWAKLDGCCTCEQFFSSMHANADEYDMISDVPNWPMRGDVFYKHAFHGAVMPEPTEDARYFNQFCAFFEPATEHDAKLLRVFIASPLYFKPRVDRPLWVIDSRDGQGVGKTKLVQMVAWLYGGVGSSGETLDVDYKQLNNEATFDRVTRRLLSSTGREKRIVLLDNVVGYFKSPALATLLTQSAISGLAPYGRGEETRQNDLTYVITSNNATVDRDLVSRSFFISLKMPERSRPRWATEIIEFVEQYRMQIVSDMIGILQRGANYELCPATRFKQWEVEVLAPMIGTLGDYSEVFKQNLNRQESADGEIEEANNLRDHFAQKLRDLGIDPDHNCVWLQNQVIAEWAVQCIDGFGGRTGRNAPSIIGNMIKSRMIPEMSDEPKKFPISGKVKRRGLMWNPERYNDPDRTGQVIIVSRDAEGRIEHEFAREGE